MLDRLCFAVLLCACRSEAPASQASGESATGGEIATAAVTDETWLRFTTAVDTIHLVAELLDAAQRYEEREADREAYGDGEDCEGVCGLNVPSLERPDPLTIDEIDMIAEAMTDMLAFAEQREGEHWAGFANQLREARVRVQSEGSVDERAAEATLESLRALDVLAGGDEPGVEVCWLAKRLVAQDLHYIGEELMSLEEDLGMRLGLAEDMDAAERELEDLAILSNRAETHRINATNMLREESRPIHEITAELEQFDSIIGSELRRQTRALLADHSSRLPLVCVQ